MWVGYRQLCTPGEHVGWGLDGLQQEARDPQGNRRKCGGTGARACSQVTHMGEHASAPAKGGRSASWHVRIFMQTVRLPVRLVGDPGAGVGGVIGRLAGHQMGCMGD